ncbi:MAG: 50S ribosomal protein L4 [Chitinophagales bacterium]|nr:50S ribosomal protein L4 [Chitinophagales bacterium]
MKIDILNIDGKSTGKSIELDEAVFAIEPNDHALYLAAKLYLANQRQGTHKTKERGEVAGSTKKLHRQKGTGGSRKGSIKNPVFGNGRIFGPRPRNYSFKLNKKVKTLATKSALSYKTKENNIIVVEDFNYNEPKTKNFVSTLSNLNLSNNKSIFVISTTDSNVALSSRNIPNTLTVRPSDLNTYDIMNCDKLVICESSVSLLTERLK